MNGPSNIHDPTRSGAPRLFPCLFLLLLALALIPADGAEPVTAGDAGNAEAADTADALGSWPQWLGPTRDGISDAPALHGEARGLKVRWRRPLGPGNSGVVVAAGRAFALTRDDDHDLAVAFDTARGDELWRVPLGPVFEGDGTSPLSTPATDGRALYALSPACVLQALRATDGEVLWRKDLMAELSARKRRRGCGTSPLLLPDIGGKPLLVVQVNGETEHRVVAFHPADGSVAWTSPGTHRSFYTSPASITVGEEGEEARRQVLVFQVTPGTGLALYALDAADGTFLWQGPVETFSYDTPLVVPGNRIYLGSFDDGSLLRLLPRATQRPEAAQPAGEPGAADAITTDAQAAFEPVWRNQHFESLYGMPVYHLGHLYGFGTNDLASVDALSGELRWKERIYHGALLRIGDLLAVIGHFSGVLRLVEARSDLYTERAQLQVFAPGAAVETPPSYGEGAIFVRDAEEIVAVDIVTGPPHEPDPAANGSPEADPASRAHIHQHLDASIQAAFDYIDGTDNFRATGENGGHHPIEIWVVNETLGLAPHAGLADDAAAGWADVLAHPTDGVWAGLPGGPTRELSTEQLAYLAASDAERDPWDRWFLYSIYPRQLELSEEDRRIYRGDDPAESWHDYNLSHRLYGMRLLRRLDPERAQELALAGPIGEAIEGILREMREDHDLSDLYIERVAFYLEAQREDPTLAPLPPRWIERILRDQNPDGGWAWSRAAPACTRASLRNQPCRRGRSNTHTAFLALYALTQYRALQKEALPQLP